jgi:hypothetical protein
VLKTIDYYTKYFYNFSVVLDILKTIYVSSPCKEYYIISCMKQWWTNTIPSTYLLYYKYHLQLHYFSSTFIIMSKFMLVVCFFFFSCNTIQYDYFILLEQWLFTLCRKTTCTKPERIWVSYSWPMACGLYL